MTVQFGEGWIALDLPSPYDGYHWTGQAGTVEVENSFDRRVSVDLTFRAVSLGRQRRAAIFLEGREIRSLTLPPWGEGVVLERLIVPPGRVTPTLRSLEAAEPVRLLFPHLGTDSEVSIGVKGLGLRSIRLVPELTPSRKEVYRWLSGLRHKGLIAEYPMRDGETGLPYDYGRFRGLHGWSPLNEALARGMPAPVGEAVGSQESPVLGPYLRHLGVRFVVLHEDLLSNEQRDAAPLIGRGVKLVRETGAVKVFEVTGVPVTFEAERSPAHRGMAEDDPLASRGRARRAVEGIDKEGYLVFGPYVPLSAGVYVAAFRLRVKGAPPEAEVAILDVATDKGRTILAEKTVKAADFRLGERWQTFRISFRIPEADNLEFRVKYLGRGDLWVDYVLVDRR